MQLNFDATTVAPQAPLQVLPVSDSKGWPAMIVASEPKPTKDSTPESKTGFLEFTLQIIDGPFKGATGFDRLNIWNNNPVAVDIAYARLSSYCHVTGKYKIAQTQELHNIPLRIVVEQQMNKDGTPNGNYTQIKQVLDINGNEPGKAGAPAAAPGFAPAEQVQAAQQQQAAPAWGQQQPSAAAPVEQTGTWPASNTGQAPNKAPWSA